MGRTTPQATLPLLDQAEETRLAYLIEAGVTAQAVLDGDQTLQVGATTAELGQIAAEGRQAQDTFLMSNIKLVSLMAGPAARKSGVPLDDLFQEGFAAMSRALQTFDPARARFATYALPRIRDRVEAVAASRDGATGLPAWRARKQRQARAIAARIETVTGKAATLDQVGQELALGPDTTAELLAAQNPVLVGDHSLFGNLFTSPDTEPESSDDQMARQIAAGLAGLDGRTRRVIELRFGLNGRQRHDFAQIAQTLGISRETASRICQAGLKTLRTKPPATDTSRLVGARTAQAVLSRIDRLSGAGLSLVEVAMAMKTEPATVYRACQAGGRDDLLARLTRVQLAMTGPQPGGTNILGEAIRRDVANRAKAVADKATPEDNDLAVIARLAADGNSLIQVAQKMRLKPAMIYAVCQQRDRQDIVTRFRRIELRHQGPDAAGTDVLAEAVRRDAALHDPDRPKPLPRPGRLHPLPAPPAWQPPAPRPATAGVYAQAI